MPDPIGNRQWILVRRPRGPLAPEDFAWREGPVPEPGPGEVLSRTLYLSIDPANRAWMSPVATYTRPVEVGGVMDGFTLAEVVRSNDPAFRPGDVVEGMNGWQDYKVARGAELSRVERREPLSHRLSLTGITGRTAYFGLLEIGRPRPGETVLVSAAAGATGSVAAQLARIAGCRVIGIAGSTEKCRWLVAELGLDGALDHHDPELRRRLAELCPRGVDVYFDNVGGDLLETVLFQMNLFGRVVCCGVVSQYDTATPAPGPRGVPGLLVVKRLRMEGFVVMDFDARRAEAEARLARFAEEGRLRVPEQIVEGLERAPEALIGVLHGRNLGKCMVRVAPGIR